MPKGKRHTPEQIVAVLRRSESGATVATVCRETNISVATFHRWKSQYGGMDLRERQQLQRATRGERAGEATCRRTGAAYPGAQRCERKKMVSPSQKRRAAR